MHKFLEYAARCCEELGLLVSVKNDEAVVFHLPFKRLDYVDCMILPVSDNGLTFLSVLPAIVPEENVPTLLEYINRVNASSPYGAFVYDMDRRELYFKVSNRFARDAEYEEIEDILRFLVYLGQDVFEFSEDDIADILEGAEDANALHLRHELRIANLLKELRSKK